MNYITISPTLKLWFSFLDEYIYADADVMYCAIIDDRKLGAKNNDGFDANENERVYSILEQYSGQINCITAGMQDDSERVYSVLETDPGQIAYPTPGIPNCKPADQGCTEDTGPDAGYITVLPPKSELSQSDCSVYADLSEQREGENQYQSLVKRKK